MVDPVTAAVLAATVVPLASGAAGEAGRQAWVSLASVLRTRFGRGPAPVAADALERAPDRPRAEVLATHLVELAEGDPEFRGWLHAWFQEAAAAANSRRDVTNIVAGQAQISGGLVQTHTITGSLSFGVPPAPPPDPAPR
ncbi:hypothetical protein [Polymorphospora rubra]|uniref:Uncharacterized protein n=1 Tax=Polymorphospora rubra TaxID=338584 RepID=A0A810N2J6_9ACTN|nr:hypothetical protein [Polymorphospora rubra]BCJ66834.1 hypothetical protein Prubr_38550 [Polymorphospora rubra]